MNLPIVTWAVIFDLHLGHRNTPTKVTLTSLQRDIRSVIKTICVLFFTGDVFDDLLSFPGRDTTQVILFVKWLLRICQTNNVTLRILEGTQSHDWQQSRLFETLAPKEADVKWVDKLCVEDIEPLGMKVLFIPDEWKSTHEQVYEDALKTLRHLKIDKVDLILMHGTFEHVVPNNIPIPSHSCHDYSTLCNYWTYAGHIHTGGIKDKIHSGVSYERLIHGEEHPKGMLVCGFDGETVTNTFIENVTAYPYISITLTDSDLSVIVSKVTKVVKDMTFGNVCIKAPEANVVHESLLTLRKINPLVRFTFNKTDKKVKEIQAPIEYNVQVVDRNNIEAILQQYLKHENHYSEGVMNQFKRYL
jgi:hypothetical protein